MGGGFRIKIIPPLGGLRYIAQIALSSAECCLFKIQGVERKIQSEVSENHTCLLIACKPRPVILQRQKTTAKVAFEYEKEWECLCVDISRSKLRRSNCMIS